MYKRVFGYNLEESSIPSTFFSQMSQTNVIFCIHRIVFHAETSAQEQNSPHSVNHIPFIIRLRNAIEINIACNIE